MAECIGQRQTKDTEMPLDANAAVEKILPDTNPMAEDARGNMDEKLVGNKKHIGSRLTEMERRILGDFAHAVFLHVMTAVVFFHSWTRAFQ